MTRHGFIVAVALIAGFTGCTDNSFSRSPGRQRHRMQAGQPCAGCVCRGCAAQPARCGRRAGGGRDRGAAISEKTAVGPELARALQTALLAEWDNEAFYEMVIERFDAGRPYTNLVAAEKRHAGAIGGLLDAYGVDRPARPTLDPKTIPATLREATERAIASEAQTMEMYERMLAAPAPPDVTAVFRRMAEVSRDRHMPALQRALGEPTGKGSG